MSSTIPSIPPRPVRAQAAAAAGADKLPQIPPRPSNKSLTRTISPANHYPHSPLYEMPPGVGLGRSVSNDQSNLGLPRRPPSVNLPSVGQEGDEYADLLYENKIPAAALDLEAEPQTRNVGGDLLLHAPKPSLPTASAKTQVEAVTQTTSKQAAALGIGKPSTPAQDDAEHSSNPLTPLRSKPSFSRPTSSASNERRTSVYNNEDQGPAELGMRVPINPLLGDVQAPSPAEFGTGRPGSMGGPNGERGYKKRNHGRTASGREVFLPPGSYGLHGHGVPVTQDKFEKDWYAKHPDQYLHDEDQGHYSSTGTGRGEFAMSSEDLNQIVRRTASRGAGFGTSGTTVTYPDEQIGYLASEQYASRSSSTVPGSTALYKMHSNVSQPTIESPLRKTSFPADDLGHEQFRKSKGSLSGRSDDVIDSEHDEDTIHVNAPSRHYNKITGGQESMRETEDVKPYITHPTEEGGFADEHGYSVPILAADEVAREIGGEDMQPAVPPTRERRGSAYDEYHASGDVTPNSRPASRPGSIHGGVHSLLPSLSRFTSRHDEFREDMHTPLEDVDEYEPLFPDEDGQKKSLTHAERFKRPQTLQHRFPSRDIWEDTPSSAYYTTTVTTPDIPIQPEQPKELAPSSTFESPEVEAARKGEATEEEKKKLIPNEERLAKSKFAPHLRDDMPTRPGLQPRFPSQDVWEDTPDSQYQFTTVSAQQEEELKSPVEAANSKPSIPPRPAKNRLGEGASSQQKEPSVPARPQKRVHAVPPIDATLGDVPTLSNLKESGTSPTEIRRVPSIPDRPKPQVPARPARQTATDGLAKTISATSTGSGGSTETEKGVPMTSPPVIKAKPQIPTRPGQGTKIANLKGNFMNDLNQRLQFGPPKEKEREPEVEADKEAKPLEDARKGRARGPQRRAPAKSPSGSAESDATPTKKVVRFSLSSPVTVWHINSADGSLNVHSHIQTPNTKSTSLPEATEQANEATAEQAPVAMPAHKLEQIEHSTPSGVPADTIAEGTVDEGSVESKMAQTSSRQATDAPGSMAPVGLATNTAGEPADPSPVALTQAGPAAAMNKPVEPEVVSGSFPVHSENASELASQESKVAGGDVEQPKATLPLQRNDEEESIGAGMNMPGGFEEVEPETVDTTEASIQADARETSNA